MNRPNRLDQVLQARFSNSSFSPLPQEHTGISLGSCLVVLNVMCQQLWLAISLRGLQWSAMKTHSETGDAV